MNNNSQTSDNYNSIDIFIKNYEKKLDKLVCDTFNIKFDEKNNHNEQNFSDKIIDNFYYILISYNNSYEFINSITDNIKSIKNNNSYFCFKVSKDLINKENKLEVKKTIIENNNKLFKDDCKVSEILNSLFVIYMFEKNKIIPVQIFEKRDIAENFRNNYFTNSFLAELKINKKYMNPLQYEFLNLCQYS